MRHELLVENDGRLLEPVTVDGVQVEWERAGTPGKLTFSAIGDDALRLDQGNPVRLAAGGQKVFYGFIFEIKRDKTETVSVTAYDQLRYLKNKDTYVYENKTATDVTRMIAEDFNMNVGALADTGYNIATRTEDNKTLFDIIQNALDATLTSTGRLFVLYDDFGDLVLRDVEDMQLPLLIDGETGSNYEYTATIDGDTYNQVKLVYEDKESKSRKIYMTKSGENINRWGVLQYYEKIDQADQGQQMADGLLSLYNRVQRSLSIKDACGDPRVRAGSSLLTRLDLGDLAVGNMMMVESVRHTFNGDDHRMNLELRGGVIGT